MTQIDVNAIMATLKPFQRRTVDHAFHQLFKAPDSTSRFLVADEVGLGKTLVARGVIARAIEHMWDDVERIDIIYICSNASIARANLPKLQVSTAGQRSFALATRLTMLATQLAPRAGEVGLADNKLNFVSFTPGTSFDMGTSAGASSERHVLFRLLEPLIDGRTALMNILQGRITDWEYWRERLDKPDFPIDPSIRANFETAFAKRPDLRLEIDELSAGWFHRRRKVWPEEARERRNRLIRNLRQMLAEICVHALEPDLVILDEFQRFKPLLETREEFRDPAAQLAQTLFTAKNPEGNPVRTLLLSATPYKLYTTDAEIDQEDHYEDFLATTRFLFNDNEQRVTDLRVELARFGSAIKRAAADPEHSVYAEKTAVESSLGSVMARTERVAATEDRDAMIAEPRIELKLGSGEVSQYLASDALFRTVGDRDPMPFWKSAPYLSHFMRGYRFNDRLNEGIEKSPDSIRRVLEQHSSAFLNADEIGNWKKVDPSNAKLASLSEDFLGEGQWRLLWMPPTVPYWPLSGPFRGHGGLTKALLFSAWNVVPDVVSGLISYQAERLMVEGQMDVYQKPAEQQGPLLKLDQSGTQTLNRQRLFNLLLPCLPLADLCHPLAAPPGEDRQKWVESKVKELLADPRLPNPTDGEVDTRWEWAALVLIDPELKNTLVTWSNDEEDRPAGRELFSAYVNQFLELDPTQLGRRPDNLVELLTEIALGSPAVLVARMLAGSEVNATDRRMMAANLAYAFWGLFNRPAVIAMIQGLGRRGKSRKRATNRYWRRVIQYCRDGNLQAVLDEAWHLAWEQQSWTQDESTDVIAARCVSTLKNVIKPAPSRVHVNFFTSNEDGQLGRDQLRLRTAFALRFGDSRMDDEVISQDAVRAAFNSPFRPFVLASTSVGQEGLDFHPWCHRLVHWDLPGNPVDLEQREGRIHRYKSHSVRKNVAEVHQRQALEEWQPGQDLWADMFSLADRAAREKGDSDLIPYWMAPGSSKVERHVPLLPFSREVEGFRRLKRQLAAYRVVFGQPRQQELVNLLDQADLQVGNLTDWAIDLSPP